MILYLMTILMAAALLVCVFGGVRNSHTSHEIDRVEYKTAELEKFWQKQPNYLYSRDDNPPDRDSNAAT